MYPPFARQMIAVRRDRANTKLMMMFSLVRNAAWVNVVTEKSNISDVLQKCGTSPTFDSIDLEKLRNPSFRVKHIWPKHQAFLT